MKDKKIDPLAGKKPDGKDLLTREEAEKNYFNPQGDPTKVKNGTSGHRGKTGPGFSEIHVAAITQALVDIRRERGTFGPDLSWESEGGAGNRPLGPVIIGKDVRFTSDCAQKSAAEVFAGNGMPVIIQEGERSTPTPVVSYHILDKNRRGENVEGIIITASHNPPEDAGYKSNGCNGGPNTRTAPIDDLANGYMENRGGIKRLHFDTAVEKGLISFEDMLHPYVKDLKHVVNMESIKSAHFGATPLGGGAHGYYEAVNELHGTNIEVIVSEPDPAAMRRTYDWDGKLRGDPSSNYVMKAIEGYRERLGVPFIGVNDNDADRFGGEESSGTLNPNHVLCVVFDYLARNRGYNPNMGVGRTIGTTHMIDLIAAHHGRPVTEVNVGFKWYVEGLLNRHYVLAGEESGGLCFPRLDGTTWVTEKDGIAAVLLMMEIIATTGSDITTLYNKLTKKYGPHHYEREDTVATTAKKRRLQELSADPKRVKSLLSGKKIAGRSIESMVIGDGIKIVLEQGVWVLKRASGTENIIKDYREEVGEGLDTARKASEEIDCFLELGGL